MESLFPPPDIRVVMLGFKDAGKSSAGNTILGGQHFVCKKTVQHVKEEGQVAGRHVTVTKAPGWGRTQRLIDTSELAKQEIILSMLACPPGPQSVLLVMHAGMAFTEASRKAAQEHVELLGVGVWSHTLVLFTHGDWLGERSIEQYIESEGKPLQWLVEKCGNRYHVFSNDDEANKVQVPELFRKVEETVALNDGRHYEMDENTLKTLEKRRGVEERRAKHLKSELDKQKDLNASGAVSAAKSKVQKCKITNTGLPENLRIVLLGQSNAGKSSVGNSLLGRDGFISESTVQSVQNQGGVSGRRVTVVNTPGWGREQRLGDTPELTRQELVLSVSLCDPGPHVLVLVVQVDETFTELNRSAVQDHMDLLGAKVWDHTLVVLNCGERLRDVSIEQFIKREGKYLNWLVDKCGNRYCVLDSGTSDHSFINKLLKVIEGVIAENDGHHYEMERWVLDEVKEKRKEEEERAKEMKSRVIKQWEEEMCNDLEKMKIRDEPGMETSTAKNLTRIPHAFQELRIILLGYRGAGKTSAGNAILGTEIFHTGQSVQNVKSEGQVAGRHITVIKASDWQKDQLLMDTSELTKQDIMLSLSMCSAGPHAVLVVVSVRSPFTEARRRAVQEHLELLGQNVWGHCMVLFTCKKGLGNITVEQYIESEGKSLQWVTEKCGNRYHALNSNSTRESTQVEELLQKIELMVLGNGGSHYEPDSMSLSMLEDLRKEQTQRADNRRKAVERQRRELQAKLKR